MDHIQSVIQLLFDLTARELQVLRCRYKEDMTFDAVASLLDVSRQRAQQIEASAINKIRKHCYEQKQIQTDLAPAGVPETPAEARAK